MNPLGARLDREREARLEAASFAVAQRESAAQHAGQLPRDGEAETGWSS